MVVQVVVVVDFLKNQAVLLELLELRTQVAVAVVVVLEVALIALVVQAAQVSL
jgi:hypothetical protein